IYDATVKALQTSRQDEKPPLVALRAQSVAWTSEINATKDPLRKARIELDLKVVAEEIKELAQLQKDYTVYTSKDFSKFGLKFAQALAKSEPSRPDPPVAKAESKPKITGAAKQGGKGKKKRVDPDAAFISKTEDDKFNLPEYQQSEERRAIKDARRENGEHVSESEDEEDAKDGDADSDDEELARRSSEESENDGSDGSAHSGDEGRAGGDDEPEDEGEELGGEESQASQQSPSKAGRLDGMPSFNRNKRHPSPIDQDLPASEPIAKKHKNDTPRAADKVCPSFPVLSFRGSL
ncbi:hypothetical protein JCM5353_000153, partial [Sporobolomyces roseus]